jgi:8-oxo-dGTP diphosphatase
MDPPATERGGLHYTQSGINCWNAELPGSEAGPRSAQKADSKMIRVVAAVIERGDRRLLIGQRRRGDSSPLKWEFPGGKVRENEELEAALARELREELGVTLKKCREIGRVRHQYANHPDELEICFYAAGIEENYLTPRTFEQVAWVLPKELGQYDFLAANRELIANLATGKIKPGEVLEKK